MAEKTPTTAQSAYARIVAVHDALIADIARADSNSEALEYALELAHVIAVQRHLYDRLPPAFAGGNFIGRQVAP